MTETPQGWAVVGGSSFWRIFWAVPRSPRYWFAYFAMLIAIQLVLRLTSDIFGQMVGIVVALVALLVVGVLVTYAFARRLQPSVNFDTGQLRSGSRTVDFADLTDAVYLRTERRDTAECALSVGMSTRTITAFTLRSAREPELTARDRELVAELLRRSSVAVPTPKPDPHDPAGKFAWMDHPNHLSRDEAIEYVLNTPGSGEPLRDRQRRKSIWIDEG